MEDRLGPALLFCPGDRPERFAKAFDAAEHVVLDLEDGVAPSRKDAARTAVADALRTEWRSRALVRLNPALTLLQQDDLSALDGLAPRGWMVPKAERAEDLDLPGQAPVVALCETAIGVENAGVLAASPRCEGLLWGSEDLIRDLEGVNSRAANGRYHPLMLHVRHRVLLAARAAGKIAVDAVFLELEDLTALELEAREAAGIGFAAKATIHPRQVPTIRMAFTPAPDDVAWARGLLDEFEARDPDARGVFVYEKKMVDAPMLARARRLLADVERTSRGGGRR